MIYETQKQSPALDDDYLRQEFERTPQIETWTSLPHQTVLTSLEARMDTTFSGGDGISPFEQAVTNFRKLTDIPASRDAQTGSQPFLAVTRDERSTMVYKRGGKYGSSEWYELSKPSDDADYQLIRKGKLEDISEITVKEGDTVLFGEVTAHAAAQAPDPHPSLRNTFSKMEMAARKHQGSRIGSKLKLFARK